MKKLLAALLAMFICLLPAISETAQTDSEIKDLYEQIEMSFTKAELDEKYGEYKTLPADRKALYDEELQETVCEKVKDNYVVLAMCEKYGIDPYSREVDKLVNDDIKALVD